jgi:hypothetical protein
MVNAVDCKFFCTAAPSRNITNSARPVPKIIYLCSTAHKAELVLASKFPVITYNKSTSNLKKASQCNYSVQGFRSGFSWDGTQCREVILTDVPGQPIGPIFMGQFKKKILDFLPLENGAYWLS